MGDLIAYRDALIAARSNGLRSVRDANGETVEYKSDREMAAALAFLNAQISSPHPRQIRFNTSKGLT